MIGQLRERDKNWKEQLDQNGFIREQLELCDTIKSVVLDDSFNELDSIFQDLTAKKGHLFKYLSSFGHFSQIEFIISLRDSKNDWEEDGIWHDDGSRVLAFSLSLNLDIDAKGGVLEIRKKGSQNSSKIPIFPFGEIIIFHTGQSGFEHKINKVTSGKRLIIAGWCK